GQWVLDLDIPGRAVGRKVASVMAATDERKSAPFGALCDVGEAPRAVRNAAISRISRDYLLRVATKSIDVQRHAVIKDADSTAQNCPIRAQRRPRQPGARGDARGFGDGLPFNAHAKIEGQLWADDKMILSEEGRFEIVEIEPVRAREFDAFQAPPLRVQNVDRARRKLPAVGR